jgi:hypothetical protein
VINLLGSPDGTSNGIKYGIDNGSKGHWRHNTDSEKVAGVGRLANSRMRR